LDVDIKLRQGLAAITRYLTAHQLPSERTLLRLDGQYGTGAVLADLAGFAFVTRGKDYTVLDHPLVQARLHLPPDQFQQRPESQVVRSLYDCPEVPVGPEGVPCRVVVATHRVADDVAEISVTDQGIGIPQRDLERIFERFYRVDPARHRSTGGTGLGLSIVKHVAASHGGEVKVWSVEGHGSTFTLSLPRRTTGRVAPTDIKQEETP